MSNEEKSKATIKTLVDKGTKVDFVDFGNGRQTFIYQIEKFRGLSIGAFKLGLTDKYHVITPQELTEGTIAVMAETGSAVSGQTINPQDFEITVKKPKEE